jgi:hypothetical protein
MDDLAHGSGGGFAVHSLILAAYTGMHHKTGKYKVRPPGNSNHFVSDAVTQKGRIVLMPSQSAGKDCE